MTAPTSDRVLERLGAIFVGDTVAQPAFYAAAGQEASEIAVVVAAAVGNRVFPWRAAELRAADDQRIVE